MLDIRFRATLGGHFGKVNFLVLDLHLKDKKNQLSTKKHFLGTWRPRHHLIPRQAQRTCTPFPLDGSSFPIAQPAHVNAREGLSTSKCLDQPQVVNVSSLKPRPDKS